MTDSGFLGSTLGPRQELPAAGPLHNMLEHRAEVYNRTVSSHYLVHGTQGLALSMMLPRSFPSHVICIVASMSRGFHYCIASTR